jgi:3-isopropylmalate dehydratase small subunit
MVIDLVGQTVESVEGPQIRFKIDAQHKENLLCATDEMSRTLVHSTEIALLEN